jgi:hypothetical protein
MSQLKDIIEIIEWNPYSVSLTPEKLAEQLLIWHLEKQRELIKVIYEAWDTNKRELCRGIDKDLSEQIEELKK